MTIGEVDGFKYLGLFVQEDGSFGMEVKHRIKCVWMKWREALDMLCDKIIPVKLKGKFYKSLGRPTMQYGSEGWEIDRRIEQSMSVGEMRSLNG